MDAVDVLLEAGADVNQLSAGDKSSPLLIALANGHFDLAMHLLEKGADPNLAGRERRRAALRRAQRAVGAQGALPAAARLPAAADDLPGADDGAARQGRRRQRPAAPQGLVLGLQLRPVGRRRDRRDAVLARRLRQRRRGDEAAGRRAAPIRIIPTSKPAGRPRVGDAGVRAGGDVSGLPPMPVGGPGVPPLLAAAGVGYGEGFAANSHRYAPTGMLAAVKYLVEELGADVNAADHEGNTALHHAAARGDIEMIEYLVSKGADVTRVNRDGQTTVDMANGPVQRIQPYPRDDQAARDARREEQPQVRVVLTPRRTGRGWLLATAVVTRRSAWTRPPSAASAAPPPRQTAVPAAAPDAAVRQAPRRPAAPTSAPVAGAGARRRAAVGGRADRAGHHLLRHLPQRAGQGRRAVAGRASTR